MQTLFVSIDAMFYTAARCAAALGITRQAYHQARTRRRLSDRAAIRAAALLKIDPGQALLINATGQNPPAPISHPAPQSTTKTAKEPLYITPEKTNRDTNYAKCSKAKKTASIGPMQKIHVITSKVRAEQLDIVRWVFAVSGIPADSPRFSWYVSRWVIPEKIARAKANGTFNDTVKNCPPINPDWLRHVPAALLAYSDFVRQKPVANSHQKHVQTTRAK